VNGDLSLRPCTGENFAAFAESPVWNDLRDPDWKTANLLDEVTDREAEAPKADLLLSSDVRVVVATADAGIYVCTLYVRCMYACMHASTYACVYVHA
jgi:hypothetical protein